MISIPIFEAKNKLPFYIHQVETSGPIQLTRHNKGVAVLLSVEDFDKLAKINSFEESINSFRTKYDDLFFDSDYIDTNLAKHIDEPENQDMETKLW